MTSKLTGEGGVHVVVVKKSIAIFAYNQRLLRWCSRQPSRCSRRWHRTWGWWRGCCGCGSGHRAGETWSIWKLFWSSMCSLSHHHYHAHHWSDPPWCIPRLLHHRPSWRHNRCGLKKRSAPITKIMHSAGANWEWSLPIWLFMVPNCQFYGYNVQRLEIDVLNHAS